MLHINADRLLADLKSLAVIGQTPDGGVSRSAMSPADVEGRAWFRQRVEQDGLLFRQDGAGNLSAVLPAAPDAPTILLGSHLDTVPNGGKFDGALGVLSALEVLRTVRDAGLYLPVNLEAISFTDEEGSIVALLGSRAVSGLLTAADLQLPRGGSETLRAGMERLQITPESALAARRDNIRAYCEIHIEQGARLEEQRIDLGVVTAIVGIRAFWLRLTGKAAHAGTMPMDRRADALWGMAAFVQAARQLVMERFTPGVMNVGQVLAQPGAFNIVPAEVRFALEFRHGSVAQLDEMESALFSLARDTAQAYGLTLDIEPVGSYSPAIMDAHLMTTIEQAADQLGLSHTRLLSFAGHDAQSISAIAPASMIFVPSRDGISHNPLEYTAPEYVVAGANVLLTTVLALAQSAGTD
jgi:N-carbamoyl-L-amino-acid hydrolase